MSLNGIVILPDTGYDQKPKAKQTLFCLFLTHIRYHWWDILPSDHSGTQASSIFWICPLTGFHGLLHSVDKREKRGSFLYVPFYGSGPEMANIISAHIPLAALRYVSTPKNNGSWEM